MQTNICMYIIVTTKKNTHKSLLMNVTAEDQFTLLINFGCCRIPEHSNWLHISVSVSSPEQVAPLPIGGGLSHCRERFCFPSPQVAEHWLQLDQSPQSPSTENTADTRQYEAVLISNLIVCKSCYIT